MNRKLFLFINLIAMLALVLSTGGHALASTSSATVFTGYYNLFGHEGIGTVGTVLGVGPAPAVGDYVSTNCRYINVANTSWNQYYLRYPLHLPNGVTITTVQAFIADFNDTGNWAMHLNKRLWYTRDGATQFAASIYSSGTGHDQMITRSGISEVVDNQNYEYWIEMSPANSAAPGQLCVYGIQVVYTSNGALLPLINNGG